MKSWNCQIVGKTEVNKLCLSLSSFARARTDRGACKYVAEYNGRRVTKIR